MKFNRHFELQGKHALLSASKGHWTNYDDEKMRLTFHSSMQALRGTDLHNLAAEHIRLGIKMPGNGQTINAYVNDAIGFRMTPEVVIKATDLAFGTPDAIGYRSEYDPDQDEDVMVLRVHDLKTGSTRTTFKQLWIYAAYFCLEYKVDPFQIKTVIRIYQNDEVKEEIVDPVEIDAIMTKTIRFDKIVEQLREEVYG